MTIGPCQTKIDAAIYLWGDVYFLRKDLIWKVDEFDMQNSYDKGYPKKIKDEFIPAMPNDVDAALQWSDYILYVLKGKLLYLKLIQMNVTLMSFLTIFFH